MGGFLSCLSSNNGDVDVNAELHQALEETERNDHTSEQVNGNEYKQFDVVVDPSDHHYCGKKLKEPGKDWASRLQYEWKVLQKHLPDGIYVKIYEDRMDILRAAIVGPAGTPYHDGLFFFDVFFPHDYPFSPPLVHYRSGGLRMNPNLYECGKVCLSLLGTSSGRGCEKWNPCKSTMLQVLVSIQALILNEKPFFNQPSYSAAANTGKEEKIAARYNEHIFLLSCKTMLYSLRNPPTHFQGLVDIHFCKYGKPILKACQAYLLGARVGSNIEMVKLDSKGKISPSPFRNELRKLFKILLRVFSDKGVDCSEFAHEISKSGKPKSEQK